ncbi:chorismate mutase [Streptomyces tendae]|uniref:chorismate mutase n=1 Tax=Streptomyces tendae TaxID=1932 RepID=UPI003D74F445
MKSGNRFRRHALVVSATAATLVLSAPQALAAGSHSVANSTGSPRATGQAFGRLGSLADLVIQRLLVGDQVAAAKFGTDSPIEDPAREQQVLDAVRDQASEYDLNPDEAAEFFRDQITASKVVQRGLFARWTAHPDQVPGSRPDLSEIRARLDLLTKQLLQELKATQHLRNAPVGCRVQLLLATGSGAFVEGLDTLHRQAFKDATPSVCAVS